MIGVHPAFSEILYKEMIYMAIETGMQRNSLTAGVMVRDRNGMAPGNSPHEAEEPGKLRVFPDEPFQEPVVAVPILPHGQVGASLEYDKL